MRKTLFGFAFVLLFCIIAQVPTDAAGNSYFIVFSDPHVGRGTGSDGWNATQRLARLIADAKTVGCSMVCTGDLTDSWNANNAVDELRYKRFAELTTVNGITVGSIKGNHDCNRTKYEELLGALNWAVRVNDILYVGVSCMSDNAEEWMKQGVGMTAASTVFLMQTTKSLDYNQTKWHFLFMHFMPNSVWPTNATHGVSAKFASLLDRFTMIFCGHEGGKETVTTWLGIPVIKCAHLGDGTQKTDSYLRVKLDRKANKITVSARNFAWNTTTPIF